MLHLTDTQSQMLQNESIQKTKNFFPKFLHNLKNLVSEGYEKLPKTIPFNPFSCGSKIHRNHHQTDPFCRDFSNEEKQTLKDENRGGGSFVKFAKENPLKNKEEKVGKKEPKKQEILNSQSTNKGGCALAQKMKDLEMIDVGDMEHVLDVEEAIHYYCRLKSPVYVEIVDNFFVDMYTEFLVPQTSVSINNSKRRLRSIRL